MGSSRESRRQAGLAKQCSEKSRSIGAFHKRKRGELGVLRARWFEHAFEQMKFGFARRAEIIRLQRVGRTSEIFKCIVRLEARESEMRRERARFAGEAERFECLLDG